MKEILQALAQDMEERGGLDLSEALIHGSFLRAKKRGIRAGKTKRGKGSKIMAIADGNGLLLAPSVQNPSPHGMTLVEKTLYDHFERRTPNV
jgi:hypothetical protein